MKILAIDTALEACSAAVYDSEAERTLSFISHDMRRGHAEALIPIISDAMKAANLEFSELDRIATTIGPGSYTGLRVGISAAKGISLASGKPAVGITTLAALQRAADRRKRRSARGRRDRRTARQYLFSHGGRQSARSLKSAPCIA